MKYILSAFIMVMSISANCQQVFHDADAEVRKVGSFTSVEVSSAIELQLSQGSEDAVAVSAEGKENAGAIKTEVKNGVLKIWQEQTNWFGKNKRMRAYVSAKSLNGISANGASQVSVNGELNCSSLFIRMSGASDFKGDVKAVSLLIELSGASDINLTGRTTDLKVRASGASHFKGYDLMADNCSIDASGASDVKLTANKSISAEASGASDVYYKGAGKEGKIRSSGASSISKRG